MFFAAPAQTPARTYQALYKKEKYGGLAMNKRNENKKEIHLAVKIFLIVLWTLVCGVLLLSAASLELIPVVIIIIVFYILVIGLFFKKTRPITRKFFDKLPFPSKL